MSAKPIGFSCMEKTLGSGKDHIMWPIDTYMSSNKNAPAVISLTRPLFSFSSFRFSGEPPGTGPSGEAE